MWLWRGRRCVHQQRGGQGRSSWELPLTAERVQVTTGQGKNSCGKRKQSRVTLFPLPPCCVPAEEQGGRTCRAGKAAGAFP